MKEYARRLTDILGETRDIIIITHKNADPDAIASAYSLFYAVRELCNRCRITLCLPEGASSLSSRLVDFIRDCTHFEETVIVECGSGDTLAGMPPPSYSVITLDMGSIEQGGCCEQVILKAAENNLLVVIDHHEQGSLRSLATLFIGGAEYSSTSEIVFLLLDALNGELISKCVATTLLAGIAYDTRRLQIIKEKTCGVVHKLVSHYSGSYVKALSLIENEPDRSQRIAMLKAFQRLILEEIHGFIVASTHIGSFESQVARSLVNNGADVAIVLSEKKGHYRISLRARPNTVDVSRFAYWLARKYGGSGGGHKESALYEGPLEGLRGNRDKIAKILIRLLEEYHRGKHRAG